MFQVVLNDSRDLRLRNSSLPNFGVVGAVDLTNRRCLTQSMVMNGGGGGGGGGGYNFPAALHSPNTKSSPHSPRCTARTRACSGHTSLPS